MVIEFNCKKCDKKFRVPDKMGGKQGRCKCGYVFKVPDGASVPKQKPSAKKVPRPARQKKQPLEQTMKMDDASEGATLIDPPNISKDLGKTINSDYTPPDTSQLTTGKSISKYDITGELGRGGMGVVYKAIDPTLNREVAIKVLISGEDASEDQIKRFHKEAEATAKLQHPNIVEIYDVGTKGNNPFFVMEYIKGFRPKL